MATSRTDRRAPLLLVLPTVLILLLALGYPIGWQLVTGLQKYGLRQQFGQPPEWVWLENYRTLVSDPDLWAVVARSIVFCIVAGVIVVWMSVPFVALSIYAGLTQVPTEVLEAAQLDGASWWQRLRYVIPPLIAPVLSIVLLLQLIWDLRVFTQIKMLQDAGGVANETNLLGTFIYQLGTGKGDFGMSSAVSVVMLLLTIALSWYYVRSLMKEEAS